MMINKHPDVNNVIHTIEPVWDSESRVLILGTMPSPKSREAGFFYMHPQNRFWSVIGAVFGEQFDYANNAPVKAAAIAERRAFLLRHRIALWDVLAACEICGAADATIRNETPNDFHEILKKSHITHVFCTGKTAFRLWQKYCAAEYEETFGVTATCLPSTSPANAAWSLERLVREYGKIREASGAMLC